MVSPEPNDGDHIVELIDRDISGSAGDTDADTVAVEISPLLAQPESPKINIFASLTPEEIPEYSGLLCMAFSSTIYFLMEVLSNIFLVQAIPLFETAFTRCTIILIPSYLWLGRSEQPLFVMSHVRNILISRALVGCLSLSSFVYWLPFSQAILLNLTTPMVASIMARVFFCEELKIADVGGLVCSFFGVLFFFLEMLATQVCLGFFSSITGGTTYCLIRAGAKASDQPLVTVFSFGILASPMMVICTFSFEDFVLPGFQSVLLMLVLGVLAFFAKVLLARGVQLERIGKGANIFYLKAELSQLWILALSRVAPSFGQVVGCLLIIISVCCTVFIGPDNEME